MALTHAELKLFETCHTDLYSIFNYNGRGTIDSLPQEVKNNIEAVKAYYEKSYKKAKSDETLRAIIHSYATLVKQLMDAKADPSARGEIEKSISSQFASRKFGVIAADIAVLCEFVFWVSVMTVVSESFPLVIAATVATQPAFAAAMAVILAGLFLKSMVNAYRCADESKSFERHDKERNSELKLLSFFKARPQPARERERNDISLDVV